MQDAVVRYKRMAGYKTLWVPGTDHAAIATNTKVEKKLIKETGQNRHSIGREKFVKEVENFVAESRSTMQGQIRKMGDSLDWSREAFTMDEKRNTGVRMAFKKMYDSGLIYRGYKVVNWDPKGQTVISDDEVVYEAKKSKLYTFKYSKDFPISISTTRPETKVGDTAVAVNGDDERYKKYIGKEYDAVFAGVPIHIKIIADSAVEKDFGTGALGVTPAHSQIDAEIAERHKLPMVQVINEYGKMMIGEENLLGKKTNDAREIIVDWLRLEGLMEKEEDIDQNISTAERTGAVIEPLPKLQWFINVNKKIPERGNKTLKELMLEPVEKKEINIMPERFERVYYNWVNNLRDWCISRQLWYGHRIPVWYKGDEIICDIEAPKGTGWEQDEDTLDTWFSSALWTFSTLGWPDEKTSDLLNHHPTDFMNPGYEILFFWVARMILMSQFLLGQIPFKTVYLHGMLRDAQGRKFSKSLDNGIDPIDVINQYGADALRMSVIVGIGPGNDVNFDMQKVKAYVDFSQ
jgi:valyl-tRNA synthetase